jgi:glutamate synthase (NADPH) large chain
VQADGQLKTGRDVVIAALLGAEEFGFATAPLVVSGCIMMRVCHLDTCPVGIATQNPELRKRSPASPSSSRTSSSSSPRRSASSWPSSASAPLEEAIGHVECSTPVRGGRPLEGAGLDLSPDPARPSRPRADPPLHGDPGPRPRRGARQELIASCAEPALDDGRAGVASSCRSATSTAPSARCSATRSPSATAAPGLPDDTIDVTSPARPAELRRVRAPGITLRLTATPTTTSARASPAAGSSCARRRRTPFVAEENIIAGNVILYGATGGEVFLRGVVGERFCVRNSGAVAVVEGVGDHGCEYMTGGRAVVLGPPAATSAPACPAASPTSTTPTALPPPGQPRDGRPRPARRRGRVVPADASVERHLAETGSAVAATAARPGGTRRCAGS